MSMHDGTIIGLIVGRSVGGVDGDCKRSETSEV